MTGVNMAAAAYFFPGQWKVWAQAGDATETCVGQWKGAGYWVGATGRRAAEVWAGQWAAAWGRAWEKAGPVGAGAGEMASQVWSDFDLMPGHGRLVLIKDIV